MTDQLNDDIACLKAESAAYRNALLIVLGDCVKGKPHIVSDETMALVASVLSKGGLDG